MAAALGLETLTNLSAADPPFTNDDDRAQAVGRFRRIVGHFEALEKPASKCDGDGDGYNRPALIRLTFDHARSEKSKDLFLVVFFQSLGIGILDDEDELVDVADLRDAVFGFAEFLMANFFLPLQATATKTPQPSPPLYHAQDPAEAAAAETPLTALRTACLLRDRHRCVITRAFDIDSALARARQSSPAVDDDGTPIDMDTTASLAVAHIIPRGFLAVMARNEATRVVMEMFDCGVAAELMKPGVVDGPGNAITLTLEMQQRFGQFHVCFSEVAGTTWRVDVLVPVLGSRFPVTTTRTGVEPHGGRLLALHAAVGRVLRGSGAGEYLRVLLGDAEGGVGVRGDGSTALGELVGMVVRMKG